MSILVDVPSLTALTSTKTHSLSILLDLGDQRITVLNHIGILLVLVIGTIRLNDTVDAVDSAGNTVVGNEFGKVTVKMLASI